MEPSQLELLVERLQELLVRLENAMLTDEYDPGLESEIEKLDADIKAFKEQQN